MKQHDSNETEFRLNRRVEAWRVFDDFDTPLAPHRARTRAHRLAQRLLADAEQIRGLARQQVEFEWIADQLQKLRNLFGSPRTARQRALRLARLLLEKIV